MLLPPAILVKHLFLGQLDLTRFVRHWRRKKGAASGFIFTPQRQQNVFVTAGKNRLARQNRATAQLSLVFATVFSVFIFSGYGCPISGVIGFSEVEGLGGREIN